MTKEKPIQLDFGKLSKYIHGAAPEDSPVAYFEKEFVVLHSFGRTMNSALSMGHPYRLDELRIARIISGNALVNINLIDYELKAGMLLYVRSGSIVQPNRLSADFDIEALSVNDDLLQILYNKKVPQVYFSNMEKSLFPLSEADNNTLHCLLSLLWNIIHQTETKREFIYSLMLSVLNFFDMISSRQRAIVDRTPSHDEDVFYRFINLVRQHSKNERRLGFYADKLCLSQHYLCSVIKQASGYTPKDWIERSVIAEAKVMLKHTDLLTYQIADELNFPNPSFFCKFFKRITGITPQQYQQES